MMLVVTIWMMMSCAQYCKFLRYVCFCSFRRVLLFSYKTPFYFIIILCTSYPHLQVLIIEAKVYDEINVRKYASWKYKKKKKEEKKTKSYDGDAHDYLKRKSTRSNGTDVKKIDLKSRLCMVL